MMKLLNYLKTRPVITILVLVVSLLAVYIVQAAAAEPGTDSDPVVTQSYVDQSTKFVVVDVSAGKQLIAGASAEMILRQGKASAIGSASGGLADVTLGGDWQTGFNIPPNHLLIVPKDDGRGLKAVTDIKIMIRGTYSIK